MSEETHTELSGDQNRSAIDNIRQLNDASKQLLEAGTRITESLTELSQRLERATDFGSHIAKNPWLLSAAAIAAGAIILTLSKKKT